MRGDRQNHTRSPCRPSLILSLWETEKCLLTEKCPIMDKSIFFCKWPHAIGMRTESKCVHSCKKMSNVPRCVTGHDWDKVTRCAIEWKFSLHYIHQHNLIIRFPLFKIDTLDHLPSTLEKYPRPSTKRQSFEFAVSDFNLPLVICNLLRAIWICCEWFVICCERFEFAVSDL